MTVKNSLSLVEVPCSSNPDIFFSQRSSHIREAKNICSSCPVIERCLTQATEAKEEFGVWGGKNFTTGRIIGFNTTQNLCRMGRHVLEVFGPCPTCRKESHTRANKKKYAKQKAEGTLKKRVWKKNFIGGKCKNGHELTINNTKIREYDKALLCSQCIKRVAPVIISSRIRRGY